MVFPRKKLLVAIVVTTVLGIIALYYTIGSTLYLDNQIRILQYQMQASITQNEEDYTALAGSIVDSPLAHDFYYHSDTTYDNPQSDLHKQAENFAKTVDFTFDCIYTDGQTRYIYPVDSCVFRRTIYQYNEVYCWVDLVYSKDWTETLNSVNMQTMLKQGLVRKVDQNWYIIVLYGY